MDYIDKMLERVKDYDQHVQERVKVSSIILSALAHITLIKMEQDKGIGITIDELIEMMQQFNIDSRVTIRKFSIDSDEDRVYICECVIAMYMEGMVEMDMLNAISGLSITPEGMATGAELFMNYKLMDKSPVYNARKIIKKANKLQNSIRNN